MFEHHLSSPRLPFLNWVRLQGLHFLETSGQPQMNGIENREHSLEMRELSSSGFQSECENKRDFKDSASEWDFGRIELGQRSLIPLHQQGMVLLTRKCFFQNSLL